MKSFSRRFCTAPMMDLSDRHCRYMWRLLSRNALLYTEMVTSSALLRGKDPERFLNYSAEEQPLALQLGGHDPKELAQSAKMAEQWDYQEVNLNVGCPSDRVQNGQIGAILMKTPNLVADAYKAMVDQTCLPVTIKHRIGIDDLDSYSFVRDFVGTLYQAGCRVFITHARKAILKGLSPKENREIPPLKYDIVYQLKQDFPDCEFIINGGIKTLDEAQKHLQYVDGVMMGREAYYNPMVLAQVDQRLFDQSTPAMTSLELLEQMKDYLQTMEDSGVPAKYILKHLLSVIQNRPGARQFRRKLSENMHQCQSGSQLLSEAMTLISYTNTQE